MLRVKGFEFRELLGTTFCKGCSTPPSNFAMKLACRFELGNTNTRTCGGQADVNGMLMKSDM